MELILPFSADLPQAESIPYSEIPLRISHYTLKCAPEYPAPRREWAYSGEAGSCAAKLSYPERLLCRLHFLPSACRYPLKVTMRKSLPPRQSAHRSRLWHQSENRCKAAESLPPPRWGCFPFLFFPDIAHS